MFSNSDNLLKMENETQEIFVEGIKKLFAEVNKERQRLKQKRLTWAKVAEGFGTTPANLSSFLSLKRSYSEPKAKALANFFDKTYLEVFDIGREILLMETESASFPSIINIQDEVDARHQIVIKGFEDKERALRLNRLLLEIEKRSPAKLDKIEGYLEGVLGELPRAEDKKGLMNGTEDAK